MTMELAGKLQLKRGATIRVFNLPKGLILDLPVNRRSSNSLLFAANRADLAKHAPAVLARSSDDHLVWIAYPKKTGGIATDLDRDHGWEIVTEAGWEGVRLIAIDSTWSAMRFRPSSR